MGQSKDSMQALPAAWALPAQLPSLPRASSRCACRQAARWHQLCWKLAWCSSCASTEVGSRASEGERRRKGDSDLGACAINSITETEGAMAQRGADLAQPRSQPQLLWWYFPSPLYRKIQHAFPPGSFGEKTQDWKLTQDRRTPSEGFTSPSQR